MTDKQAPGPPRVPVTQEFLAECRAKQAAYAASRRQAMAAWDRPDEIEEVEAEPVPAATSSMSAASAASTRRKGRQRIFDGRQLRLHF